MFSRAIKKRKPKKKKKKKKAKKGKKKKKAEEIIKGREKEKGKRINLTHWPVSSVMDSTCRVGRTHLCEC
jgi:hypothetical protein